MPVVALRIAVAITIIPIMINIPIIPARRYERLETKFIGSKNIFIVMFPPLCKEIEYQTAGNYTCYLSGDVYAYSRHEKEVLVVLFKSELVDYTA